MCTWHVSSAATLSLLAAVTGAECAAVVDAGVRPQCRYRHIERTALYTDTTVVNCVSVVDASNSNVKVGCNSQPTYFIDLFVN